VEKYGRAEQVTRDNIMRCRKHAICMPGNYGKNTGTYSYYSIFIVKIYIKISYIRSYMFRSAWTILRELTLGLAKVTLL
jgi:hypothetical protein